MLQSKTNISFENKKEVEAIFEKTLKNFQRSNNIISQVSAFHQTEIKLAETTADIKVVFSKRFYIVYFLVIIFFLLLPKETPFIWASALAAFVIFSAVMYFSLDYKVKTILDGF